MACSDARWMLEAIAREGTASRTIASDRCNAGHPVRGFSIAAFDPAVGYWPRVP